MTSLVLSRRRINTVLVPDGQCEHEIVGSGRSSKYSEFSR